MVQPAPTALTLVLSSLAVCPPQPWELQAWLWHRLRHPVLPGVHLPDPGSVCPRGRG